MSNFSVTLGPCAIGKQHCPVAVNLYSFGMYHGFVPDQPATTQTDDFTPIKW